MDIEYYVVDAFIQKYTLFSGNQAAICFLNTDDEIDDEKKQAIATEVNFSDTAFVSHLEGNKFYLRWFTPEIEVPWCGHATLATSFIIFSKIPNVTKLHFIIKNQQELFSERDTTNDLITIDFPVNRSQGIELEKFPFVSEILYHTIGNRFECRAVEYSNSTKCLLVHINTDTDGLKSIKPNFDKLLEIKNTIIMAIIVTVIGVNEIDFHSRFFAPWAGVNEDPVCGSAHTVLTPYWSKLLGKCVLRAKQESKRGGILVCESIGERVKLSGHCKLVISGHLFLNN